MSDVRNIKLPPKSQISKAHTQGSGPCWVSIPAPLSSFPGRCRWARHLPHTPRSFPDLFLYNYFSRKAHLANAGIGKPLCTATGHQPITHAHTPRPQIPQLTFQSRLKNSALLLNTKIAALLPFLSAPSASRVAFEPHLRVRCKSQNSAVPAWDLEHLCGCFFSPLI